MKLYLGHGGKKKHHKLYKARDGFFKIQPLDDVPCSNSHQDPKPCMKEIRPEKKKKDRTDS
jgi:hypothetical protein